MTEELRHFVTEETKKLLAAPSVGKNAKDAAKEWLAAAGTKDEESATKAYVEKLAQSITTIDELDAFAHSADAVKYMGEAAAKGLIAHAEEIRKQGARYCDCPACAACGSILEKFGRL